MDKSIQQLLKKHPGLTHSENRKVTSHVQREDGDWYYHTLMLEGVEAPFKYKRKQAYKNLKGARVNLTFYPDEEIIAGIPFEIMKVVRLRVA